MKNFFFIVQCFSFKNVNKYDTKKVDSIKIV